MTTAQDSSPEPGPSSSQPRAVIHKRILDVAEQKPEATLSDIAGEVSGASVELVDRVLAEYGDPTKKDSTDEQSSRSDPSTAMVEAPSDSSPDPTEASLTETQVETLREIRKQPTATQAEIADALGVTPATVCRRVNAIEGFDWEQREAFVDAVFADGVDSTSTSDPGAPAAEADGGHVDSAPQSASSEPSDEADGSERDEGEHTTTAMEQPATDTEAGASTDSTDDAQGTIRLTPELAHKLVHAAIESDRISEEDERYLLRELLTTSD